MITRDGRVKVLDFGIAKLRAYRGRAGWAHVDDAAPYRAADGDGHGRIHGAGAGPRIAGRRARRSVRARRDPVRDADGTSRLRSRLADRDAQRDPPGRSAAAGHRGAP